MKKVIISFIAGALLMASGQAMADNLSLVGKKVAGEAKVVLNGKEISSAVIIDSKSYAPVRDITESFGANVGYESGVITIKSSDEIVLIDSRIKILEGQIRGNQIKIAQLDKQIPGLSKTLELVKSNEPNRTTEAEKESGNKLIKEFEDKIAASKAEREQLLQQIDDLNKEIAELESTK